MSKYVSAAAAAILALATGACQQPTAQQINATNANSPIYIGALSCSVSGSSSYLFGSTKDLSPSTSPRQRHKDVLYLFFNEFN